MGDFTLGGFDSQEYDLTPCFSTRTLILTSPDTTAALHRQFPQLLQLRNPIFFDQDSQKF